MNCTQSNPIITWNKFLTCIAINTKTSIPDLARNYALLHIALYNSILKCKLSSYYIKYALITGAAYEILNYLYPICFAGY